MNRSARFGRAVLCASLFVALAPHAGAWPESLATAISHDARRLLPRTLVQLLASRERDIVSAMRAQPSAVEDLVLGGLTARSLDDGVQGAITKDATQLVSKLQGNAFTPALVEMGTRARMVASLADPALALTSSDARHASEIRDEFYAFVELHHAKFPLVISDPKSLELRSGDTGRYLASLRVSTRQQRSILIAEMGAGRVPRATDIDLLSPVFAAASSAYSRAVVSVAAYWLAIWRDSGGDMTRQPKPYVVRPRE